MSGMGTFRTMTLLKALRTGFVLAAGLAAYTAWKQLQGDVPNWHVPAAGLLWGTIWFTALTIFVADLFKRAEPEELPITTRPIWCSWINHVAALLLFAIYVKTIGSLIGGSNFCQGWDDDGRFCRTALMLAAVALISAASFLFAWFYGWRPALRPFLNYIGATFVGATAGAAICLMRGEWSPHIVAVATLLGPLFWLNRRFLVPAILLEPFDRTPDPK